MSRAPTPNGRLGVLENILYLGTKRIVGSCSVVPVGDTPLPIDDDRRTQAEHFEQLYQLAVMVSRPGHIGRFFALPKTLPIFERSKRGGVNRHHRNALFSKLLLNPAQGWSLQPTRGSTGEGKIEHHYFIAVVAG